MLPSKQAIGVFIHLVLVLTSVSHFGTQRPFPRGAFSTSCASVACARGECGSGGSEASDRGGSGASVSGGRVGGVSGGSEANGCGGSGASDREANERVEEIHKRMQCSGRCRTGCWLHM